MNSFHVIQLHSLASPLKLKMFYYKYSVFIHKGQVPSPTHHIPALTQLLLICFCFFLASLQSNVRWCYISFGKHRECLICVKDRTNFCFLQAFCHHQMKLTFVVENSFLKQDILYNDKTHFSAVQTIFILLLASSSFPTLTRKRDKREICVKQW